MDEIISKSKKVVGDEKPPLKVISANLLTKAKAVIAQAFTTNFATALA